MFEFEYLSICSDIVNTLFLLQINIFFLSYKCVTKKMQENLRHDEILCLYESMKINSNDITDRFYYEGVQSIIFNSQGIHICCKARGILKI